MQFLSRVFLALFWLLLWFLAALIPVRSAGATTGSGPPPDFVLHVECGYTNSSVPVVLPARPAEAIGVRLQTDHDTRIRHGWETNSAGLAFWQTSAWISSGWSLRSGTTRLAHARLSQFTRAGGVCVPFDGTLDYAGFSGGSVSVVRETSGSAEVTLAQLSAGLRLDTHARSAWSISIIVFPPGFGWLWWLNEVQSSADFSGWWIFPPPLPPPSL